MHAHTYVDISNSNSKWIELQEKKKKHIKNHKITKITNKLRREAPQTSPIMKSDTLKFRNNIKNHWPIGCPMIDR